MEIICKNGNIYYSYHKYLQSNHWKKKRQDFLESKLYKNGCEICNSTKKINIHHKTYKRIGNEKLNDLTALCEECHLKLHEELKENPENLWKTYKRMRKQFQRKNKKNKKNIKEKIKVPERLKNKSLIGIKKENHIIRKKI